MISHNLPPHTRVWIYQSNRELSKLEADNLLSKALKFVDSWMAHGKPVHGNAEVRYNRFLILFADEEATMVSGCSIDSSVAFVKKISADLGLDFFDRKLIAFLENNDIKIKPIHDFWALKKAGVIKDETLVFNNLVKDKQEFDSAWLGPFAKSWHAEMFR